MARLGGDEFAFLIFGQDVEHGARRLAERVLRSMRRPFDADGTALAPGGSLGIAVFMPGHDPAGLMRQADEALYDAKRRGGGRWTQADDLPSNSSAALTAKAA